MHTIQNLIDQIRFKPPMFSDPLISKVCSVCYTRNCLMMYRRGQNRKHAVCLPKAERFTLPGLHRCYRVLIVAEQLFHIPPAVTPDGLAHVNLWKWKSPPNSLLENLPSISTFCILSLKLRKHQTHFTKHKGQTSTAKYRQN